MGTETGVPERPVGRGPEAELELSDLALDSSLCSPGPGPKPQLWLLLGKTGQRRPPSRVRVTIKRNTECQVPGKVLGTRRTHKLSCRLCFTHSGEPSPSKPLKAGRQASEERLPSSPPTLSKPWGFTSQTCLGFRSLPLRPVDGPECGRAPRAPVLCSPQS